MSSVQRKRRSRGIKSAMANLLANCDMEEHGKLNDFLLFIDQCWIWIIYEEQVANDREHDDVADRNFDFAPEQGEIEMQEHGNNNSIALNTQTLVKIMFLFKMAKC